MARYSATLRDQNGHPYGGLIAVALTSNPTQLEALTADDGSPLANPLPIGADGAIVFNTPTVAGVYDLIYYTGGRRIGRDLGVVIPVGSGTPSVSAYSILSGLMPYTLPDEATGATIPAAGSGLPYLSGGVFKIA